jgi:hypothetical protein
MSRLKTSKELKLSIRDSGSQKKKNAGRRYALHLDPRFYSNAKADWIIEEYLPGAHAPGLSGGLRAQPIPNMAGHLPFAFQPSRESFGRVVS